MSESELGVVTNVRRTENDEGKTVLRVTVDFFDGAAPPLTFNTVWKRVPVKIMEVNNPGT